jgi:hypothetical protein
MCLYSHTYTYVSTCKICTQISDPDSRKKFSRGMTSNTRLNPDSGKPRDPSVLLGERADKRDSVGSQGLIQLLRDHSARQVSDMYPGIQLLIQCCRSDAFMIRGSKIGFFRILDPPQFFGEYMLSSSIGSHFFPYLLKNKIIYNFVKFMVTKKVRQQIFYPSSFLCCWFRDGKKSGSGKNIPDPQGLLLLKLLHDHSSFCAGESINE